MRDAAVKAKIRLEKVETRSYEVEFVGGLSLGNLELANQ